MTTPTDPILDAELDAYVDGQLSLARRIEVEAHLGANPELASRVMTDLGIRDRMLRAFELRDAAPVAEEERSVRLARKLQSGFRIDRYWTFARRGVLVLLLVSAGWVANETLEPMNVARVSAATQPPDYVNEAIESHRAAQLRGAMKSQSETSRYDRDEVRSATAIYMPELPQGWTVVDTQVVPSDFGPSVQMSIRTPDFGPLSLFATRPGKNENKAAAGQRIDDSTTVAYWQAGEVGYALVADADVPPLRRVAARLAGAIEPELGNGASD